MAKRYLPSVSVSRVTRRSRGSEVGSHPWLAARAPHANSKAIADPAKFRPLRFGRKSTANQIDECVDGLLFVRAARFDGDLVADRRSEQHHGDHTAGIGPAS